MRRAGRTRIAALVLIALLIGVPGLLRAACPSCSGMAMAASQGPSLHPACCGGGAERGTETRTSCCSGPGTAPASSQAAIAPQAPAQAAICADAAPAVLVQTEEPAPLRQPADPPWSAGVALYTLHSTLLI